LEPGKVQTVNRERDRKFGEGRDLEVLVDLNSVHLITRLLLNRLKSPVSMS
jgi:hypothetical protein